MTKVIIGLGNPDIHYALTRHNFGWRVIDALADKYDVNLNHKSKFSAAIGEFTLNDEKVLLVKPLTYYNNSGLSVRSILDFYKISPADILVVHDELALPLGSVRCRLGGSAAGNNGVRSIIATIGEDFARIRLGIKPSPSHQSSSSDFVLSKFTIEQEAVVGEVIGISIELVDKFINENLDATTIVTTEAAG